MATLYDITQDYLTIIEGGFIVDMESGEVLFDQSNLDAMKATLDDKIEAVACYVKNQLADAEALRAEEKALADRRRAKEAKAERLKSYMLDCMRLADVGCVETARAKVSTRKASHVEVTDEAALKRCAPVCFKQQPDKLDKVLLRKILKEGAHVDGAEMVESASVVIK